MSIDTQQRITLAQCVNLAKDLAIAQKGDTVTVEDVSSLVEEVYLKLFKQTCSKVYKNHMAPKASVSNASTFIKSFKEAKDPIAFRNSNRELLSSFSREDRTKIITEIGE